MTKMSEKYEVAPTFVEAADGIQQIDRKIPRWWKGLFGISIGFAPFYLAYYHGGEVGRSSAELHSLGLGEATKKQYKEIGELAADEATMVQYLNEPNWLKVGESIFKANCVSCHGAQGGGNVGPNLCDDSYKSVKLLPDIINVIDNGLAGGAMPAWGKRLGHKNDVILTAVYVASLRGSKPANAKGAEGSPIAPWPTKEQ
jgi:cytochrome c oxidase cbb3-type subunit III